MKDTPTRVFSLMCALVGVWVVVYWFYEPAKPPVTFDPSCPAAGGTKSGDAPIRPDPLAQLDAGKSVEQAIAQGREQAKAARETGNAGTAKPEGAKPTGNGTRVVAPTFKDYTVERGDTFEVIAKKMLGDAKHWKAIASANAFVDPRKLVPGKTVLRIPVDPENVEGKTVTVPEPSSVSGGDPSATKPEERKPSVKADETAKASGATEYVVKNSDTLSGIAKAFYGKSAMWREIYEANKDVIDDPDHLKPGVTIRIPGRRQ